MRPEDFRIGNYFNYGDSANVVLALHSPAPTGDRFDGSYVVEINPPDSFFVRMDDLTSIEITEKWLHTLGFEYDLVVWSRDNVWLAESKNGWDVWLHGLSCGITLNLHYVHEVQNLLYALKKL